jgi:predicted dehydrogenase
MAIVSDLDEGRLGRLQTTFPSIQVTTDYRELLNSAVDAVVIATPVSTHHRIARDAIMAGKHVMIEKPLAASVEQAKDLVELADRHNRRLMVGHVFEYNPAVDMLRDCIASGELGDIYYLDMVRATLGLFQKDINVIWDLAPHDFSILRYVLQEEPVSISARGRDFVQPGIHDTAYITVNFPRGIQAHVRVSWLEPNKQRHMTVVGSKKMLVYDDTQPVEKIRIYDMGVEKPDADALGAGQLHYRYGDILCPRVDSAEPLQMEMRDFARSILEEREPRANGRDGLEVVRMLELADQSLYNDGTTLRVTTPAQVLARNGRS